MNLKCPWYRACRVSGLIRVSGLELNSGLGFRTELGCFKPGAVLGDQQAA